MMPPVQTCQNHIAAAQSELRQAIACIDQLIVIQKRALGLIESAIEGPLQDLINLPLKADDLLIDPHRAAHRVGSPSRIDTDPELTAFIRARIDRLTFKDIAAEIAGHFPPDRRASVSGLHRWFHRQKRHAAAR